MPKEKRLVEPKCPLCHLINIIHEEYHKNPTTWQYCGNELNEKKPTKQ